MKKGQFAFRVAFEAAVEEFGCLKAEREVVRVSYHGSPG